MPPSLLSSAPTLDEIKQAVRDFYCGGSITFIETGAKEWSLIQTLSGKKLDGVRVVKKGSRYRFEVTE